MYCVVVAVITEKEIEKEDVYSAQGFRAFTPQVLGACAGGSHSGQETDKEGLGDQSLSLSYLLPTYCSLLKFLEPPKIMPLAEDQMSNMKLYSICQNQAITSCDQKCFILLKRRNHA